MNSCTCCWSFFTLSEYAKSTGASLCEPQTFPGRGARCNPSSREGARAAGSAPAPAPPAGVLLRFQPRHQVRRCDLAVCLPHQGGDHVPVGFAIDPDADPALVPHVGRAEAILRILLDQPLR